MQGQGKQEHPTEGGGLKGPGGSSAMGQGWLEPSCESGVAQDVPFCSSGQCRDLGDAKPLLRGAQAPPLLWDTARDERGGGGAAALCPSQGGTQPWQEQAVDTPTAPPTAPHIPRSSPPVLPLSTDTAPQRSAVLPVLLAGGLSKVIPIPWFPMGGMEQE